MFFNYFLCVGLFKFDCTHFKNKQWWYSFLYSFCRAPYTVWNVSDPLQILYKSLLMMERNNLETGEEAPSRASLAPRALVALVLLRYH